jgi:hypothetical protein
METLRFPLEKAVANHRTRLNMIAGIPTGPHPGLDEQFREASAELLSVEVQAFIESFYRQQVAVRATEAEKVKTLSEVHLTFIKFAHETVQEESFRDGVSAAAISAVRRVFIEIFGPSPASHSSGPA